MARKGLYLSIPSPCDQSWDEMVAANDGRYCNNCRKTVIDFTQYSDEQILSFLKGHKGALCGHVRADQLNRNLLPMVPQQRLVPAMLLTAGMLLAAGAADAQVNNPTRDSVVVSDTVLQACKTESVDTIQPCVVNLPEITVMAYGVRKVTSVTGGIISYSGAPLKKRRRTIIIFGWDTHIPVPQAPSWLRKR
ncbi:hypothetical protein SAMN05444266_107215 [Chitinophaga jiangningensis]|uniref:Uncharacterized protein n=1 Tax=Chitinophaga jiangningensis TaxID=1419482 RepID=A0A1M7HF70_9BACT|nr:hypothetical protein [Chitinophaga jiangningensis]SHM27181.1 hypothetical protein SAMN05444266_107215 [Chitinophaga jiangningensis]